MNITKYQRYMPTSDQVDRAQKAVMAYNQARGIVNDIQRLYTDRRDKKKFVLSFPPEDEMMDNARKFVMKHTTGVQKFAVFSEWDADYRVRVPVMAIAEGQAYKFRFSGYAFEASMGNLKHATDFEGDKVASGGAKDGLTIVCPNRQAMEAVLAELHREVEKEEKAPKLMRMDPHMGWRNTVLPHRSLDTVILRSGVKERLVNDLRKFLELREDYTRLGIPYHRGYLLSGPPGTGKSSIATSVANELKTHIYVMSLHDINSDQELNNRAGQIQGGVLLLEDVDAVGHTGVSESALFNLLDGVGTPDGLITILTSNHPEELNPTLLRPGRVDLHLEIDLLDDEQMGRLYTLVTDEKMPAALSVEGLNVSPATIIGVVKEHLHEPETIAQAIQDKIAEITLAAMEAEIDSHA